MFEPSGNPEVHEITAKHVGRTVNLSGFSAVERDGKRYCFWCNTKELHGRKDKKYCTPKCKRMTWAWSNPQGLEMGRYLIVRQAYKCKCCAYDWRPLADELNGKYWTTYTDLAEDCTERLLRLMKNRVPDERRIETDHILPISLGGLGLDISNLQLLCYTCHKVKTKADATERARRRREEKNAKSGT